MHIGTHRADQMRACRINKTETRLHLRQRQQGSRAHEGQKEPPQRGQADRGCEVQKTGMRGQQVKTQKRHERLRLGRFRHRICCK